MGRMYGQGKGISKSSMPYKKVPPRWLSIDSKEVTNLIETLAKKGFKPSRIGIILRDNYAVPQSMSRKSRHGSENADRFFRPDRPAYRRTSIAITADN